MPKQGKALRPFATPFLWPCPKKREWRPKEKRFGGSRRRRLSFTGFYVS